MPQITTTPAVDKAVSSSVRRHATAFQRGQGMTEYIIIVALIAVAAIGVYQFFGQVVRSQTAAIASEVGGVDGKDALATAKASAQAAGKETDKKGLDGYTGAAAATGAK